MRDFLNIAMQIGGWQRVGFSNGKVCNNGATLCSLDRKEVLEMPLVLKILVNIKKKKRIRETLTLSACADSSTNFMKSRLLDTYLHFRALCSHLFALFCDFSGNFL